MPYGKVVGIYNDRCAQQPEIRSLGGEALFTVRSESFTAILIFKHHLTTLRLGNSPNALALGIGASTST